MWIEIKQDKTVIIHAPKGCKIESDETVEVTAKKVDITAPEVSITGDVTVNGNIKSTGDMSAGGISLQSHTHRVTAAAQPVNRSKEALWHTVTR